MISQLHSLKSRINNGTLTTSKSSSVEAECQISDNEQRKEVCDEHYQGAYHGLWHDEGWVIDSRNCTLETKSIQMKDLVTIVIVFEEKYFNEDVIQFANRLSEEINLSYKGVKALIATNHPYKQIPSTLDIDNIQITKFSMSETKSEMWISLIRRVKTPYVLVGRSLHSFYGKWINLERSVRLLGSK